METQPAGRGRRLLVLAEHIVSYVAAVVVGFVLMVVGLGLGVTMMTMILLPVGLVVGLPGVGLFVCGMVGHSGKAQ